MEDLNQNLNNESLFDDNEFDESVNDETKLEESTEEVLDNTSVNEEEKLSSKETEKQIETQPFLKIKFNKENKDLTKEEATILAQKGMNYDRLNSQYQAYQQNIERLAAMNNMTGEEYLQSLEQMQTGYAVNKEFENLKVQFPDADERILKELAEKRVKENFEQERKTADMKLQSKANEQKKEIARQVEVFEKRYPNLKADQLDQAVYDMMNEGYTLLEAYSIFKETQNEIEKKKEEDKKMIEMRNVSNKNKNIGNISSSGDVIADDFLSGFNS